jgi:hypothetical protein
MYEGTSVCTKVLPCNAQYVYFEGTFEGKNFLQLRICARDLYVALSLNVKHVHELHHLLFVKVL